jgi:TatD DNase family protein
VIPAVAGLVDALAHLDDPRLADVGAALGAAAVAGVTDIVSCGVDPLDVGALPTGGAPVRVWRGLGIHPQAAHADRFEAQLRALEAAVDSDPIVAIGEIGLDGRGGMPAAPAQEAAFEAQLRLAAAAGLPVVLHCVGKTGRMLELLRRHAPLPGVWHAFSGPAEVVEQIVELGLCLSFGARLLNPRSRRAHEAAPEVPGDRLLVETDAPDVAPAALRRVVEGLAALRGASPEAVGAASATNARHLYKLSSNRSK